VELLPEFVRTFQLHAVYTLNTKERRVLELNMESNIIFHEDRVKADTEHIKRRGVEG
jgi:hypothetical protein